MVDISIAGSSANVQRPAPVFQQAVAEQQRRPAESIGPQDPGSATASERAGSSTVTVSAEAQELLASERVNPAESVARQQSAAAENPIQRNNDRRTAAGAEGAQSGSQSLSLTSVSSPTQGLQGAEASNASGPVVSAEQPSGLPTDQSVISTEISAGAQEDTGFQQQLNTEFNLASAQSSQTPGSSSFQTELEPLSANAGAPENPASLGQELQAQINDLLGDPVSASLDGAQAQIGEQRLEGAEGNTGPDAGSDQTQASRRAADRSQEEQVALRQPAERQEQQAPQGTTSLTGNPQRIQ